MAIMDAAIFEAFWRHRVQIKYAKIQIMYLSKKKKLKNKIKYKKINNNDIKEPSWCNKIAVFPLTRPTLFQTSNSAIFFISKNAK